MRKYKILKYIPWILFPVSILIIILLREGILMDLGLSFDLFHNLCGLSAVSGFIRNLNLEPIQLILTKSPIRVGINALMLTILIGPVFCGYICPFGTLQRIIKFIGSGIGIKTKTVPYKLNKSLSYIKYIFLVLFIFLVFTESVNLYIQIDPYHSFIRLFYGGVAVSGGLYLIVVIILSLFFMLTS